MGKAAHKSENDTRNVRVSNRTGRSPYVIVCDHASNNVPPAFAGLGLTAGDLSRHIAWDPGALPVARQLAESLDAALVEACVSRLVIDCNRPLDAADLIPTVSENTAIPGNAMLSDHERAARIAHYHAPFHAALDDLVARRLASGLEVRLVAIHSFTPVYKGRARPWHIGVLHDEDERMSLPMLAMLRTAHGLVVGDNEPYSPADRVYYTLERHGRRRGCPCVMVEIRNDEIAEDAGQHRWAERLSGILKDMELVGMTRVATA